MGVEKYLRHLPSLLIDPIRIYRHKKWMKETEAEYPMLSVGRDLQKFKGIGKGKRCFIVGNGPSLRASDLDKLVGEDCFAANGIWKIYEKTDWRASYYFLGDPQYAQAIGDSIEIPMSTAKEGFFVFTHIKKYPNTLYQKPNVNFYYQPIHTIYELLYTHIFGAGLPLFSRDITKNCYSCGTITYEMLQTAVYMGYEKIYLIGIDHTYMKGVHFAGCSETNDNQIVENLTYWEKGYRQARMQAEKRNIHIYNSTRGGELEVFERVDFDVLLL